mmetsp:Transcript_35544/g.113613  ORF Transcript_35544/g.113613 Transcript_35544/m.113613 type:complete len:311 (-) Transcript_35544:118-1050(-)
MAANDRVAIHEVMEQQTVTLAKAGIHASLNARCSILAAANPVYGSYDSTKRPQENIGLPDSLLSRFDLIFLLLDSMDAKKDQKVADHVIGLHRTSAGAEDGGGDDLADVVKKGEEEMLQEEDAESRLKRFLSYAKSLEPVLHADARNALASGYADLRAKADERTLPVTARCLESLIRLATAHAKLRLDDSVTVDDCNAAFELVSAVLYGEKDKVENKLRGQNKNDEQDDDDDEMLPPEEPEAEVDLRRAVVAVISEAAVDTVDVADLTNAVNEKLADHEVGQAALLAVLTSLENDNVIMLDTSDNTVTRL